MPDVEEACVLVTGGVSNTFHEGATGGCHFMPLLPAKCKAEYEVKVSSSTKWRDMAMAVEGRVGNVAFLEERVRDAGDCYFHSILLALHFKGVVFQVERSAMEENASCPPGADPQKCLTPPPSQPSLGQPLSLQYHYFMVAKISMRIIINNEISLIIIFRYYNNIDNFDEKITICLPIIIFSLYFSKNIIQILGKYHYYCAKISFKISLFFGLKKHYFSFHDFLLRISKSYLSNVSLCFLLTWLCFHCFSLDIVVFFFEGVSLNINFFTQGSTVLFFKCIIMCPLKYFSCPLGYICFGSNINSIQHASNTQGRKNIQKKIFLSFFPKFFCFPLELFSWFCNTHMFPKIEKWYLQGCLLDTHIETQKLTSSFTLGTSKL